MISTQLHSSQGAPTARKQQHHPQQAVITPATKCPTTGGQSAAGALTTSAAAANGCGVTPNGSGIIYWASQTTTFQPAASIPNRQTITPRVPAGRLISGPAPPSIVADLPPTSQQYSQNQSQQKYSEQQQPQQQQHQEPVPSHPKKQVDTTTPKPVSLGGFVVAEDEEGCIITPNKSRVRMNTFLMKSDAEKASTFLNIAPSISATSQYAQDIYSTWRAVESMVDPECFQLCFKSDSYDLFRRRGVSFMFEIAADWGLCGATIYTAITNVNRVLLHYADRTPTTFTANLFGGTVAACLRMSIKHDETPEISRRARSIPAAVCQYLNVSTSRDHVNCGAVNAAEGYCISILSNPMTIPNAHEFLDRYVRIGQWPEKISKQGVELSEFLLDLTAYHRLEDDLGGIVPSMLAACALSLSVRIVSNGSERYEPWPLRLEVYSGYTKDELKRGVKGITGLLRNRPSQSLFLARLHPVWGNIGWR